MTIEKIDSFSESRAKGVSFWRALRGERTSTEVQPNQVVLDDGRIISRSTSLENSRDRRKFREGALMVEGDTIKLWQYSYGSQTILPYDDFAYITKNKINEFAKHSPFPIRWRPTQPAYENSDQLLDPKLLDKINRISEQARQLIEETRQTLEQLQKVPSHPSSSSDEGKVVFQREHHI